MTVPPEEFARWLSANYPPDLRVHFLTGLGYVILVAYKNETAGIGATAHL